MTFKEAQQIAARFNAKPAIWNGTEEVTGCWMDRIAWLPSAAELGKAELTKAITEANRYSGR